MKAGDRVAFRARFLRSICDYSAESANRRGTVLNVSSDWLLTVAWDNGDVTKVLASNVIEADRIHLEPA